MRLFKNGVGRPSNEIKKKRRLFIATCVCMVLITVIFVGTKVNSNKIKAAIVLSDNNKKIYFYNYKQEDINGVLEFKRIGNYLNAAFYKRGDVNLDGIINEDDANLILNHITGNIKLNNIQLKIADVNNDGKVSAVDAKKVLQQKNYKICLAKSKSECKWDKIKNNQQSKLDVSKSQIVNIYLKSDKSDKIYTLKSIDFRVIVKEKGSIELKNNATKSINIRYNKSKKNKNEYGIDGIFVINRQDNVLTSAIYRRGDVNLDNFVNEEDAKLILDYIVGNVKLNNSQLKIADVNNDGKVSVVDAKKVLQQEENPGGFKNYKICISMYNSKMCDWDELASNVIRKTILYNPGTYYIHILDVNNNKVYEKYKSIYVDKIVKPTTTTTSKPKPSIEMSKYMDNWRVNTGGIVSVKVTDTKLESVTSSNPGVMVIRYLQYNKQTSSYEYDLIALGVGETKITATAKSGDKVSYTYTVSDDHSPSSEFINNKYSKDIVSGIDIYTENTCNSNNKKNIVAAISKLPEHAKNSVSEVYIKTDKTFEAFVEPSVVAYTTGRRAVFRCSLGIKNNEYGTEQVVSHEFGHSVAFYYEIFTGSSLYNVEKNISAKKYFDGATNEIKKKILRPDAYDNINEYFAAMYAGYTLRNTYGVSEKETDNLKFKFKTKLSNGKNYDLYPVIKKEVEECKKTLKYHRN